MKPYQPDTLPLADLDHKRLFALVGDANAELARYDALLQATVNSAILLSPLTNKVERWRAHCLYGGRDASAPRAPSSLQIIGFG